MLSPLRIGEEADTAHTAAEAGSSGESAPTQPAEAEVTGESASTQPTTLVAEETDGAQPAVGDVAGGSTVAESTVAETPVPGAGDADDDGSAEASGVGPDVSGETADTEVTALSVDGADAVPPEDVDDSGDSPATDEADADDGGQPPDPQDSQATSAGSDQAR